MFCFLQHPGGGELITEWAGRDATKGFDDFGHSNDAKKMLRPFRIGELIEVRDTGAIHMIVARTKCDPACLQQMQPLSFKSNTLQSLSARPT